MTTYTTRAAAILAEIIHPLGRYCHQCDIEAIAAEYLIQTTDGMWRARDGVSLWHLAAENPREKTEPTTEPTADKNEKILRKIRSLLAKANDQAGTPEGDIFQKKAFDLIAKYGIDQAELRGTPENPLTYKVQIFEGKYKRDRAGLLGAIAGPLGCCVVWTMGLKCATIYGRAKNIERTLLLFHYLDLQVAARIAGPGNSVEKRSWIYGFSLEIMNRLESAENTARGAGDPAKGEIAHLDDVSEAEKYRDSMTRCTSRGPRRMQTDGAAMQAGSSAARRADIGQKRMGKRARSIAA